MEIRRYLHVPFEGFAGGDAADEVGGEGDGEGGEVGGFDEGGAAGEEGGSKFIPDLGGGDVGYGRALSVGSVMQGYPCEHYTFSGGETRPDEQAGN
jgi:hypothetical protein